MPIICAREPANSGAYEAHRDERANIQHSTLLLIVIPDLDEVRAFARHIHVTGKHWQGELFGWQAEYTPENRKKPVGSKMLFTPAGFWIGESGIWFFSLMWEQGRHKPPVEFLDDRGIVKPEPIMP